MVSNTNGLTFVSPLNFTLNKNNFPCSSTRIRYSKRKTIRVSPTCIVDEGKKSARRSLSTINVPDFLNMVQGCDSTLENIQRNSVKNLQINIGLTCNLACRHCHVESSPSRTESMPAFVADRIVHLVDKTPSLRVVDITGGAPEMHEQYRPLVKAFSKRNLSLIDRCNLTILEKQPDLASFLAEHRVKVIASLPCYSPKNVEHQRGNGVFDASILALQQLNEVGYGIEGSGLELDLVYNPIGPVLPPSQTELEIAYKRELKRAFDINFSNLICITNMPIKRFADELILKNKLQEYMELLVSNFNAKTINSIMCRDLVHVAWDGSIHDCDFNYALDLGATKPKIKQPITSNKLSIFDIESFEEMAETTITTGKHCYGCTAGSGSSCGGSLA